MSTIIIGSDFPTKPIEKNESLAKLLIESLSSNGQKPCLIDCSENIILSRKQVLDFSFNFSAFLKNEFKIEENDVILFIGDNSWIHAIGILSTLFAAGVYASAPSHSSEEEINQLLQLLKPRALINISDLNLNAISRERLLIEMKTKRDFEPVFTGLDALTSFVISSGSTGTPKAIKRTNRNHLAVLNSMAFKENQPLDENDIFLSSGFSHICGQRSLFSSISSGSQLAIVGNDETHEDVFSAINRFCVTSAVLIPTQLNWLIKNKREKETIKSLNDVMTGSMTLSPLIHENIEKQFGFKRFRNSYGMSEIGFALLVPLSEIHLMENRRESVGKVCSGFQIKVIDENGNSLSANKVGEICISGDCVSPGYLNLDYWPQTEDGFFRSGDIGYYDENKYFFIVGRIKEMIKVEGVSVAPKELENLLLRHSDVTNACVLAKEDQMKGHVPMAYVTLVEDSHVTDEELIGFVNEKVNYFKKLPKKGLKILKFMPKTHSGKVDKKLLKIY